MVVQQASSIIDEQYPGEYYPSSMHSMLEVVSLSYWLCVCGTHEFNTNRYDSFTGRLKKTSEEAASNLTSFEVEE